MNFIEAIESVLIKNYFNLDGKATRSEFWWFYLFYIIFFMVVISFTFGIALPMAGLTETAIDTVLNYLTLGLQAALFLPLLGLTVRRFADAGRGKREAIVVFVLAEISSLIAATPGDEVVAIIQAPEFLSTPASLVSVVTRLYTIYIALKKSV